MHVTIPRTQHYIGQYENHFLRWLGVPLQLKPWAQTQITPLDEKRTMHGA